MAEPARTFAVPDVSFETVRRSHAFFEPITRRYFRTEVRGMDRIPSGQCLVVTHHDGGILPLNGICFGVAWYSHFAFERPLYVLAHDLIHATFTPFTDLLPRSGVVPADRVVMDAVAQHGHSMLVMPGAARESFRTWGERAAIDLGGRRGFVRQAMRHRMPIVPMVAAGSHETMVVLSRGSDLAKRLGINRVVRSGDVLPIVAGLPWGLWALPFLPQLPLPAKITMEVLEPVVVEGDPDAEADVERGFAHVLDEMKRALARLYDARRFPIIG